MATIYRKLDRKPIPAGAEVLTRKNGRVARWIDPRGRPHTAPLSGDGTRILVERAVWYIDYEGPDGRRKTASGYRDKEATQKKARDLVRDAGREREGLPVADREKALTPTLQALEIYLADLDRKGRDSMYRYNQRVMISRLLAEVPWHTVGSIRADAMTRWLGGASRVPRPRKDGSVAEPVPLSATTRNRYLETAMAFLNFLVALDYLETNPLRKVARGSTAKKERERRALSDAEVSRLLALEMPEPRRLVYRAALQTGLRKDELAELAWGDLDLDSEPPLIRLRETCNKVGREDTIGLHPQLARNLREVRPDDASPSGRVFPAVPKYLTTTRDFRRAGIVHKDSLGRQADFHSLRHTFCTHLQRAGVSPGDAMRLMRHTDLRLTLKRYTDPALLKTAAEVARLPDLGPDRPEGL